MPNILSCGSAYLCVGGGGPAAAAGKGGSPLAAFLFAVPCAKGITVTTQNTGRPHWVPHLPAGGWKHVCMCWADGTCPPPRNAEEPHVMSLRSTDHLIPPSDSGNRGNSSHCLNHFCHRDATVKLFTEKLGCHLVSRGVGIISKESYASLLRCLTLLRFCFAWVSFGGLR